jgi:lipopolysaccharide transport system ATP-binding protein
MSDLVIDVADVSRMFRRYRSPRYRVLELLGFRPPKGSYDEFWALRGVSLQVRRGERVALIGGNGAGKSTLLSIICGRLRPTGGAVHVRGKLQALMELGTGFIPDFTARQNVLASLAYQGVTGRRAEAMLDEVIEFAELQDFVDQPVKTYSAGMYARLAFSAATAIEPDVLIIDEVLGAGDAYFAAKCADRMKQLTVQSGATVLFVSHDMSSVERLCQRAAWIERGSVRMEGEALDVSKAYYASVLQKEEERLRAETARALKRQRHASLAAEVSQLVVRLRVDEPAPVRHDIGRVTLRGGSGRELTVLPGGPMDNDETQSAFVVSHVGQATAWAVSRERDGRHVRAFEPHGQHLQALIAFNGVADMDAPVTVEIEHAADSRDAVRVELLRGNEVRQLGWLGAPTDTGWTTERFVEPVPEATTGAAGVAPAGEAAPATKAAGADGGGAGAEPLADSWGTDEGTFVSLSAWDVDAGRSRTIFGLGDRIGIRAGFRLARRIDECWFVAVVYSIRGERVALHAERITRPLTAGEHVATLTLEDPNLRQGDFTVSLEILPEFTLNWGGPGRLPFICHCDRAIHFKIDERYTGTIDLGLTRQAFRLRVEETRPAAVTMR